MLDKAVVSKTPSQIQEVSVHVVSSKRKLFWEEGVLINDQDHVAKTARLVDVPPCFRKSHASLQKRSSNITYGRQNLKKGLSKRAVRPVRTFDYGKRHLAEDAEPDGNRVGGLGLDVHPGDFEVVDVLGHVAPPGSPGALPPAR